MGVRIICDDKDGLAVLYCSVTMRALPIVFEGDDSREQADLFLALARLHGHGDVRSLDPRTLDDVLDALVEMSSRHDCDHRVDWSDARIVVDDEDEYVDVVGLAELDDQVAMDALRAHVDAWRGRPCEECSPAFPWENE